MQRERAASNYRHIIFEEENNSRYKCHVIPRRHHFFIIQQQQHAAIEGHHYVFTTAIDPYRYIMDLKNFISDNVVRVSTMFPPSSPF